MPLETPSCRSSPSLGSSLAPCSGAVLTETMFNLAGVGRACHEGDRQRDYATVIRVCTLLIAIAYLSINLIVDVSYAFLDPRIRLA